ncbi:MAG: 8-oxo-dGTP diphosphatase MutT [Steroidobacteraceae bacterium]
MIHVVAGVVIDRLRRVLIAQRPAGKHLAGAWEFPGGKLEPGEAPGEGLARELREEIGITIRQPRPLIRVHHAYPHGEVLLDVWVVRRYRGKPRGLDGQRLRWCNARELLSAELLPADRPILAALRLPQRLRRVSTPVYRVARFSERARGTIPRGSAARLLGVACRNAAEARAAAGRADFLVLREAPSCRDLAALCGAVPVPVFVPGMALERAWALGASGINAIVC